MLTSNNNIVCENKLELGCLESFSWVDVSSQRISFEDLYRSYKKNAYLLLRSFFDENLIKKIRKSYTSQLKGALDSSYGTSGHPAAEFVKSQLYLSFISDVRLVELARVLLCGDVSLLKRKILRTYEAGSGLASPAHRDIEYFPEGTDKILTTWVPLGDCPVETGGILYLKDSHTLDLSHLDFTKQKWISRDFKKLSAEYESEWLATDFKAGDIILHSPYIVHGTLDCTTVNKRISTDIRFAKKGEVSDWRWDSFWQADDGY